MITVDLNSIFPSLSADLLDEMHEHGSVRHLWVFLLTITGIAIAGIVIGGLISKRVRGDKLKKIFGWFVMLMGVYILISEIFFKL